MQETNEVPVFFASDKNYIPYLKVAIKSLVNKVNEKDIYRLYVLTNDITEQDFEVLKKLEKANVSVVRVDVNDKIASIQHKVVLRDYYSVSIYFRLFIPSLFPQYSKAIYLDSDVVVNSDIADLYKKDLGSNFLGGVSDECVQNCEEFISYVENALNIKAQNYINSGVLLMNLDALRDYMIEDKFYEWLNAKYMSCVAPDQDFLNKTCKGKIMYLEKGWDKMPLSRDLDDKNLYIIHYNMFTKPWRYDDVFYSEYFWEIVRQLDMEEQFLKELNSYSQEMKDKDTQAYQSLLNLCLELSNNAKIN